MKKLKILVIVLFSGLSGPAQNNSDLQPFIFDIRRLITTLDYLGAPFSVSDKQNIEGIIAHSPEENTAVKLKTILDKYALFNIEINPESRVKVTQGSAKPVLQQGGWNTFLIKIVNDAGATARLQVLCDEAKRDYDGGEKIYGMAGMNMGATVTKEDIADRWLDMSLYTQEPMKPTLSGLQTEYFVIQLYSRDSGKRAAGFRFNCGPATQDIGLRDGVDILFNCVPSLKIKLKVMDENQNPTTAAFIIKDQQNHIYPSKAKRLAPDFFFQPQVYRATGETIDLPAGVYSVEYGRGPEYLSNTMNFNVTNESNQSLEINLKRWIDPSKFGWYSGDHHIHAAGCSHYTSPTQGVSPEDMMRHIVGEALNVGSVLTWGPGYYYQKQFFEGKNNALSTLANLMRYDLEISGFPSSHAGHLVLLGLKDQDYPGTRVLEDWPTWTIPILKWAKAQGAVTGYAHSGLGLGVETDSLPNYAMPRFDGIGANEYIVAVTQNLVDFISTMDTPPTWELNIWYHTLNCGYRTRISGETDFPCMSDNNVGHGRSYVKLDRQLNFDDWVEGIKSGRCYTSDGKSHIMDFRIDTVEIGKSNSQLHLEKPQSVKISAKVAAYLNETIDTTIHPLNIKENVWTQKPFWDIEKGRIGKTRRVLLELIVNGNVAATKNIVADGTVQDISFETMIDKSSWLALRILPSSHTNPIFVLVGNAPVRASKKSAAWCLQAVDQCWKEKSPKFSGQDKDDAAKVYEMARKAYRKILSECEE